MQLQTYLLAALLFSMCASLILYPDVDLMVSSWFFDVQHHFFLSQAKFFLALHWIGVVGAWVLGGLIAIAVLITYLRKKPLAAVSQKGWIFLFVSLLVGPVLVVNVVLKDHWGRARPVHVSEFGGTQHFTSAWVMAKECDHNCSFVAGDPAFGFYLTTLAYLFPRRRSRLVFWSGIGIGSLFGLARIAMGSHFLSDVLYAAVIVIGLSALLHTLFYRPALTISYWRTWLFYKINQRVKNR